MRVAWWVSFNGWAQIFGGLVAYGFAQSGDNFSIARWKIVFIFTGLLAVVFEILLFLLVPDNQLNAWWLTK